MMDTVGNKAVRQEIMMIKVAAPNMALNIIDNAMQLHGGAMSQEFPLAYMSARSARALRFAESPDEVHRQQIAHARIVRAQQNWTLRQKDVG